MKCIEKDRFSPWADRLSTGGRHRHTNKNQKYTYDCLPACLRVERQTEQCSKTARGSCGQKSQRLTYCDWKGDVLTRATLTTMCFFRFYENDDLDLEVWRPNPCLEWTALWCCYLKVTYPIKVIKQKDKKILKIKITITIGFRNMTKELLIV